MVASATAEQGVLGSIPGSDKVLLSVYSHGVWICAQLMAIGSPPFSLGVLVGTPLPNPSGITGEMLCMYVFWITCFFLFTRTKLHGTESAISDRNIVSWNKAFNSEYLINMLIKKVTRKGFPWWKKKLKNTFQLRNVSNITKYKSHTCLATTALLMLLNSTGL